MKLELSWHLVIRACVCMKMSQESSSDLGNADFQWLKAVSNFKNAV